MTGEIIPTGGRGRKKKKPDTPADVIEAKSLAEDIETIRRQQIDISTLSEKVAALEAENKRLKGIIKKASQMTEKLTDLYADGMRD